MNIVIKYILSFSIDEKPVFTTITPILEQMVATKDSPYKGKDVSTIRPSISYLYNGSRDFNEEKKEMLNKAFLGGIKSYLIAQGHFTKHPERCEEFISDMTAKCASSLEDKEDGKKKVLLKLGPEEKVIENCLFDIEESTRIVCRNIPLSPDIIIKHSELSANIFMTLITKIESFVEKKNGTITFEFNKKLAKFENLYWAVLYSATSEERVPLRDLATNPASLKEFSQKGKEALGSVCTLSFELTTIESTLLTRGEGPRGRYSVPYGRRGAAQKLYQR